MAARHVTIAGGGIAGLTAALAFSRHGFSATIHERAEKLDETGAGIQLSPNATRLLQRLGVLDRLLPAATIPEAVVLRDAASLRDLAHIPLGDSAVRRWGAPYLALRRADLQGALLDAVAQDNRIELETGAAVDGVKAGPNEVALSAGGRQVAVESLLVGADGAHSQVRRALRAGGRSMAPETAWRRVVAQDHPAVRPLLGRGPVVSALLHPQFHLVAYPMQSGRTLNLAAFTHSPEDGALARAMAGTALAALADEGEWTRWPIHLADPAEPWTHPAGVALIGDAAHAMTPFAAQGAAMAVEDAWTLAQAVASAAEHPASALAGWEQLRRPRVARVAKRGAFNRFAWHAAGPFRIGRDAVRKLRGPERLAADLDWLYGWTPDG